MPPILKSSPIIPLAGFFRPYYVRLDLTPAQVGSLFSTPVDVLQAEAGVCLMPGWATVIKDAGAYTVTNQSFLLRWMASTPINAFAPSTDGLGLPLAAESIFHQILSSHARRIDNAADGPGEKKLQLSLQTSNPSSNGGAVSLIVQYYKVPISSTTWRTNYY